MRNFIYLFIYFMIVFAANPELIPPSLIVIVLQFSLSFFTMISCFSNSNPIERNSTQREPP